MENEEQEHQQYLEEYFGTCSECGSVLCLCGVCEVCAERERESE